MFLFAFRWVGILVVANVLFAQDAIQVHGYVQGRFTDEPGTPNRLEIRRARLVVSGTPVSKLSYRFQVDFAKRPYLMDALVGLNLAREFTLTAGQMKIPFSAESLISDNLNAPIARSRAVLSLAPGRDTGVQGRDVGTMASGALSGHNGPVLEYSAGVFRGQTLIYSPKVHYNATAARVVAHPIRGLSVGVDWYGSFTAPGQLEKRREEVESEYHRGRLNLRGEEIWARDGTLERRGGYGLGWWRLSESWESVARADWLTTNVHKANTSSTAYMVGANRFLWNHTKIGFNVGAENDPGAKPWSRVLLAQMMLFF
jgi:hypothetical protein